LERMRGKGYKNEPKGGKSQGTQVAHEHPGKGGRKSEGKSNSQWLVLPKGKGGNMVQSQKDGSSR